MKYIFKLQTGNLKNMHKARSQKNKHIQIFILIDAFKQQENFRKLFLNYTYINNNY